MTQQSTPAVKAQKHPKVSAAFPLFLSQVMMNVGLPERLLSIAVGMTVVLLVVRRFLLYGALAVAGVYLLYRGLTGYCPLYASEAIDTRNRQWQLPLFPNLGKALALSPLVTTWRQPFARSLKRSKDHEQDNSTRQMATDAWQPEDGMGPLHGE